MPVGSFRQRGGLGKRCKEQRYGAFVDPMNDAREETKLRRTIQVQAPVSLVVTNLAKSPYATVERIQVPE